jgi:hypothetical protein
MGERPLDRGWLQLKVEYFCTEEEALDFLENALALEELANRLP